MDIVCVGGGGGGEGVMIDDNAEDDGDETGECGHREGGGD